MIRPSSLAIARHCTLSPRLAAAVPDSSAEARRGTAIHAEIEAALRSGGEPDSADARAAVAWARQQRGRVSPEVQLTLEDPETGELITRGTCDLVIDDDGDVTIVDWKSGRPEYVDEPEQNAQLWCYAASYAVSNSSRSVRVALAFLADGHVDVRVSEPRDQQAMWAVIEEIAAISRRPPVASAGPWCETRCWVRHLCETWRGRAATAIAAITGEAPRDEIVMTDSVASRMAERLDIAKRALALVEEMVRGHVRSGGRVVVNGKELLPSMRAGRAAADIDAMRRDGLTQYLKIGKPYETWNWRKI